MRPVVLFTDVRAAVIQFHGATEGRNINHKEKKMNKNIWRADDSKTDDSEFTITTSSC